jgi:hypothetical protein
VLLVQWDGYVCNPDAWDPAFLDCDYIGAKWFWHNDAMRVGNGGFSLRSRRLLEALQDPRIALSVVEDETICRTFRPLLERDYGIVSPTRLSPIASHLKPRTRLAGRSAFMASSTSAASCQGTSSQGSRAVSTTRSLARRSSCNCCATV